jgi:hypothetical protein
MRLAELQVPRAVTGKTALQSSSSATQIRHLCPAFWGNCYVCIKISSNGCGFGRVGGFRIQRLSPTSMNERGLQQPRGRGLS